MDIDFDNEITLNLKQMTNKLKPVISQSDTLGQTEAICLCLSWLHVGFLDNAFIN